MALTKKLQLLTSPQEAAGTAVGKEDGNIKTGGCQGPYRDGTLFRWAEYHQNQFWQRLAEQNLGPLALSILSGKSWQEESTTQEYRKFLRALTPARTRDPASEVGLFSQMHHWLAILGNGCSLLLVASYGIMDTGL